MKTFNDLPLYVLKLNPEDPNSHVEFLSTVDRPAIETNWVAMNNKKKVKLVAMADESSDKQIIVGPAMIPNFPIYRSDEDLGEYYVTYDADTVDAIRTRFNKEQRTLAVNYMHQPNSLVDGAIIIEQWMITDKANDKSNSYGFDLPVGTWMVMMKFENKKFWDEEVKTGNVRGISIEGFLDMEMKKVTKNNKHMKTNVKMEVFRQSDGGCDVYLDGPIAEGTMVFSNYPCVKLVNGVKTVEQYPVWQDMIVLETGEVLTLKDAKIILVDKTTAVAQSKINKTTNNTKMKKLKMAAEVTTTDGVKLTTSGDWAEGAEVMVVAEDGTTSAAPDGDHTLEDGTIITIKDGKMTAWVEAPALSITEDEATAMKSALGFDKLTAAIEALTTRLGTVETAMSKVPGSGISIDHKDDKPATTTGSNKITLTDKIMKMRNAQASIKK